MRLCHSRVLFVRAYPRETQEMVFDAHDRALALFKGACTRGIYDDMKIRDGNDLRRPRTRPQSPLSADAQPLPGRSRGFTRPHRAGGRPYRGRVAATTSPHPDKRRSIFRLARPTHSRMHRAASGPGEELRLRRRGSSTSAPRKHGRYRRRGPRCRRLASCRHDRPKPDVRAASAPCRPSKYHPLRTRNPRF